MNIPFNIGDKIYIIDTYNPPRIIERTVNSIVINADAVSVRYRRHYNSLENSLDSVNIDDLCHSLTEAKGALIRAENERHEKALASIAEFSIPDPDEK